MLNPSSPAQKSLGEEDSSGSDAGSEAGLEPETDRFGFIVTNGSTAGSIGPSPELVRQREAKWISIILQWDRILAKKTSKVKVQCQKGIPASLRAKCWPLLCGATERMKQNLDVYQSLDSQPALQTWVDIIERDLDRQFPFHEMFLSKDGHGQRGLFRVLKAYTQYQPEEGYCQAQGPVAAVLLMNMPAEEAFWCLVQISEQYLPGYYSPLLEGVLFDAAMLTWVLKRTCPAAHKHLQHHGVEPLMFATDWLMCLFTRHLPFNTLLRVWDLFFCYGVRVLLQVAVVLVRRVLGRADQRKQCQGQMETLERLRGVREEVQHEDDTFIAEVCSVPLSARDLEKQTEKELERWRKDKPSSTFDPRGRCQGYRMAWERAREHVDQLDRKEREEGNLSVPLARSASTLSLSPSILHKRWRKGGKANEGEGGKKVVRHLSMGAKEDCMGWTEFNFKKVQGVQEEDVILEDFNKQNETKKAAQTEQTEAEKIQNNKAVTKPLREQTREDEVNITETEKDQQAKETNVETELSTGSAKEEIEIILKERGNVELPTDDQSKDMDKQCDNNEGSINEVKDTKKETKRENDKAATAEGNQSDTKEETPSDLHTDVEMGISEEQMVQAEIKLEERTDIEDVQQTQVDTATEDTEVSEKVTEGIPDAESDSQVDLLKDVPKEMETLPQEVNTETDNVPQGNEFEGKLQSTESLAETEMKDSNTQPEITHVMIPDHIEDDMVTQHQSDSNPEQTYIEQPTDSQTQARTSISCHPEHSQCVELVTEAEVEAIIPVSNGRSKSRHAVAQCVGECDTEPAEERETAQLGSDQIKDKEAPPLANTGSIAPPQEGKGTPSAQPGGNMSSEEKNSAEEPVPEEPEIKAAVEEQESRESVQEITVEEDNVFISAEPTDLNSDPNPKPQESELSKNGPTQGSSRRSSRSSADFCIRKSSNSRGARIGRRLSQDLFTEPQKSSPSQSIPSQSEDKHTEPESGPGAVKPKQTPPDETQEVTSLRDGTQQEPSDSRKRFTLFTRLRGEQAKKPQAKRAPKMQVPKILIQDFSDGQAGVKPMKGEQGEKLSSRERRRRRRERERQEKEEEKLRKKREKEQEKERERRKPQTRGKSFQLQKEKGSCDDPAKTKTLRSSTSYAESYF